MLHLGARPAPFPPHDPLSPCSCNILSLQMHSGNNTGVGRDHTIYSLIDGVVVFTEKRGVKVVTVVPAEEHQDKNPRGRADGKPTRRDRTSAKYPKRASVVAAAE